MKKFAAFILVLILAAGGYMFATGQLQISFPADRTNSPISHAAAESKSQPDESALDGMKRIDTQIWNAIKNGMIDGVENKQYFGDLTGTVAGKTGTAQESRSKPDHALYIAFLSG